MRWKPVNPRRLHAIAGLCLAAIAVANLTGLLSGLAPLFSTDGINHQNREYLDAFRKAADYDALRLSELFAFLEIVGSTRIGFEFIAEAEIGVGRAASALSLSIEQALIAVAVSAVIADLLGHFLAVSAALGPGLFNFALVAAALHSLALAVPGLRQMAAFCRSLLAISASGFLIAYVLVPYSIQITGWVVTDMVSGLGAAHRENLQNLSDYMVPQTTGADPFAHWRKAHQIETRLQAATTDIHQKIHLVKRYKAWRLADAIAFGFALPLASFFLMLLGFRQFVLRFLFFPPGGQHRNPADRAASE